MVELEHVPTVPELHARGMATVVEWTKSGKDKKPTHYRLSDVGQQLVYDTMARNARLLKERDREHRS